MKKMAFLLLLALASFSQAEEAVLKASKGQVSVQTRADKDFRAPEAGQKLNWNDRVRVEEGGVAHLVFKTGDVVLVKDESVLTLKRDKRGTLVAFEIGEFLIGIKRRVSAGRAFRVQTPAAITAVRGTAFWSESDKEKKTTLACFTGQVEVWAKNQAVSLKPGQTVAVVFGEIPGTPQVADLKPGIMETFSVAGSVEGVDQLIDPESRPK